MVPKTCATKTTDLLSNKRRMKLMLRVIISISVSESKQRRGALYTAISGIGDLRSLVPGLEPLPSHVIADYKPQPLVAAVH